MLLCRTGPFTHKAEKAAGWNLFARATLSLYYPVMQKFPMPCPAHRPAAFPAFARSLSADRLRKSYSYFKNTFDNQQLTSTSL
jgi:hypothetical protein